MVQNQKTKAIRQVEKQLETHPSSPELLLLYGSLLYEKSSILPIVVDNKIVQYLAIKLNITEYVEQQKASKAVAQGIANKHNRRTDIIKDAGVEEYEYLGLMLDAPKEDDD